MDPLAIPDRSDPHLKRALQLTAELIALSEGLGAQLEREPAPSPRERESSPPADLAADDLRSAFAAASRGRRRHPRELLPHRPI